MGGGSPEVFGDEKWTEWANVNDKARGSQPFDICVPPNHNLIPLCTP